MRLLGWYLCFLALLAPLKFGSVIGPSEIPVFPAGLLEWVFGAWPPFLLGGLSGLGLGWALSVCPGSLARHPARPALWAWVGLLVSCAPGLWLTTEWDYAVTFILYLGGVCAFVAAVMLVVAADPRFRRNLLMAIAAGTLASGLLGWYQRLWGFAEMRRFVEMQARESGRPLSVAMQGKILQTRVHRPFFHPNSYAAHLVLTGPLALVLLWRAGRRVDPRRVSQPVLVGVGLVTVFGALVLSGSRAAQLALGVGLGLAILACRPLRRWRWPLLAAALIGGLLLTVLVNSGRDLLSASARFDYYRAAVAMFLDRPWTGVGLGEFLSGYLGLKPAAAEETRAAHNMILEMLSQAGLAGGLAAVACASVPLWLAFGRRREPAGADEALRLAAVAGLGAWVAHALLDFNLQIPPTVTLAAALPALCLPGVPAVSAPPRPALERSLLAVLALIAVAALWRIPGERRFREMGDCSDAGGALTVAEAAERAAAALPLAPEPWILEGKDALAAGRPHDAAEAFRRALRRAPRRSAVHAWLGQATLLCGDITAAESAAREAWRLYPTSGRAVLLNALVRVLQSGETAGPTDAGAWVRSVLSCRARVGNRDGALVVWLDPGPEPAALPVPVPTLCARFSELGLRTPGQRSQPVLFQPPGGPG